MTDAAAERALSLRERTVRWAAPAAGMAAMLPLLVRRVGTPDFFWHVRTGQWMVQNHALVREELYTFTVPGTPWTAQEYGTELVFYVLQRIGGLVAVSVAFALGYWLGFWALFARIRQQRYAPFIAGSGLFVGAAAGFPVWATRPEMWDVLFGALELYWLERFMTGRSRAIWFLPLVIAAWANLHGGFIFGLYFSAIFALALLLRRVFTHDRTLLRPFVTLAAITVLSALAALVTPWGPTLYTYVLKTEFSSQLPGFVAEYQSPDFHMASMLPFGAMVLLVFAGFVWRRPRLHDLLLVLTGTVLSLRAWYFIPIFVMTATPLLVWEWSVPWERLAHRLALRDLDRPQRAAGLAAVVVVLIAAVGVSAYTLRSQKASTAANYPVAAVDWLAAHPNVGTHMFNEYSWGGYILDRLYPQRRVFIYGELELMGDPLVAKYVDVNQLHSNWQDVLNEYNIDYVVFPTEKPLDAALTAAGWKLAYSDSVADIFTR